MIKMRLCLHQELMAQKSSTFCTTFHVSFNQAAACFGYVGIQSDLIELQCLLGHLAGLLGIWVESH